MLSQAGQSRACKLLKLNALGSLSEIKFEVSPSLLKWAVLEIYPIGEGDFYDDYLRLLQNVRTRRLNGPRPLKRYFRA